MTSQGSPTPSGAAASASGSEPFGMAPHPRRICIVRQGYYPDDPRVRRDVASLVAAGWDVTLVCIRKPSQPSFEGSGPVSVHRLPLEHHRTGAARYLFEYLAFLLLASVVVGFLHIRRRFDVVQVHNLPDFLILAGLVPKLLGARLVLDFHEPLPELCVTKLGARPHGRLFRLAEVVQRSCAKPADAVLAVTNLMKASLVSRGIPGDKVTVVHVTADGELLQSLERAAAGKAGEGTFDLVSHGTISRGRGLDTMIRAVCKIRVEVPSIRLHILGDGEYLQTLRALVAELGVEDCVSLPGFVSYEEMVNSVATADLGLVGLEKNAYSDLVLTNKMFDFFALGRPVVIDRTAAVEHYFGSAGIPMHESGDVDGLVRIILDLHKHPEKRRALERVSRSLQRQHNWETEQLTYLGLLDSLTNRSFGETPVLSS